MENPVNVFVAGFLGLPPMNLFSGGFVSGNKLVLDDYLIPLPARVLPLVQDNQPVTLGMRQEAVSLSVESTSTNGIQLPAEIQSFESDFVHRTQTVHLRSGRWNYSGLCPLDMEFRTGQWVHVQLDPARFYFFDAKSGLRI
jgi:ABC-type sugar transport system ATPase subunit